jgi:hypothetical protein
MRKTPSGNNSQRHHLSCEKGANIMQYVYFGKLYKTKFQAGCLAKRLEQNGWIYGYNDPHLVEIFRSRKGRYGVRFIP